MDYDVVKGFIFDDLRKSSESFNNMSNQELNFNLFYHPAGIRLSYQGYLQLKKLYKTYEFNILPKNRITARNLLDLASDLELPYYIGKEVVILFSEKDSFLFTLKGGTGVWVSSI